MTFLQKVVEHFQNSVILSDFSIKLIGVCLILLAIFALYHLFFNSKLYEKHMPWIGIAIRILMFLGFTMEFAHHTKISPLPSFYGGKDYAVAQLSSYLFFTYILVVGVYDILTIGINKFRGFFHSFDIAMVSIPIIYTFTSAAIYLPKESFKVQNFFYMGLLLVIILMIYLLFQVYWKQNTKVYSIFYLVAIPEVTILLYLKFKAAYTLPIFLLLLGMYEGSRHIVEDIKVKSTQSQRKNLKLCSVAFIMTVAIFGLTFSGINPIRSNASSTVYMLFNKSIKLTTVQEAEKAARTAIGDNKSKFILTSGTSMDFYNFFYIVLGDYKIDVSEDTGKVVQIHNNNLKKAEEPGTLKLHEVKDRTVNLLKQCGYIYEAEESEMDVEDIDGRYEVLIKNKFSNGRPNKLENINTLQINWFKNGSLSDMLGFGNILNLKDYKEIKIDEKIIEKSLNTWYEKLGEKAPAYAFNGSYEFTAYSNRYNTLSIICDNGDSLWLDINDGTVRTFKRDRQNWVEFDKFLYEKYRDKAIELHEKIMPIKEKAKYILDTKSKGYSTYSFMNEGIKVSSGIDINLDIKGKLYSFAEVNYRDTSVYSEKEFKVSKNHAQRLVANKYKTFNIYTKRAKLIEELQPNGDTKLKWMVVVIPYMSREHHIYFVDVNTGETNALQSYKGGFKNE